MHPLYANPRLGGVEDAEDTPLTPPPDFAEDEGPVAPSQLGAVEPVILAPAPEIARNQIDPNDPDDLTPQQREYLAWLLDPQHEGTKKDWARAHKVNDGTPHRWEALPKFKEALNRRMVELNLTPMRTQRVLDAMFIAAENGNTQAAKLILDHMQKLNPIKPVIEDVAVEKLTDEELNQRLGALMRPTKD